MGTKVQKIFVYELLFGTNTEKLSFFIIQPEKIGCDWEEMGLRVSAFLFGVFF